MQAIIAKTDLLAIVESLCRETQVIAPVQLPNGDLLYSYIDNADTATLETDCIPIMSAKEFFLPSEEELFRYERETSRNFRIRPLAAPDERVFVGIRSCDLKGVRFLQNFFQQPFDDKTVTAKIERTLFLSVACVEPPDHCFCVCCDAGPFLAEGTDGQLVDLGDRFLCETFTPGGENLFSRYGTLFRPVCDEDLERKSALIRRVDQRFARRSYMAMGIKQVTTNTVPEDLWDLLANRCINCGSCTFVCPTCTCFTMSDRETAQGGARVRVWDSCSYSGFTREASGHNPRGHTRDRLKRRFFHKLSYQCLRSNGRIGCVGCGRCVVSCPAIVDMSTFVTMVRQAGTDENNGEHLYSLESSNRLHNG